MISKEIFGETATGFEIYKFTLDNGAIKIEILNFGGTIRAIKIPDKIGNMIDISLGFDKLSKYENNNAYIGATIGRNANRIRDGKLNINGDIYHLERNDKNNHLHGGNIGFDKKIWDYEIANDKLILTYFSGHLEENYPGNLRAKIIYELTTDNAFKISYYAVSDRDTICNLTNHSYFNLSGHNSGTINDHKLKINANYYTPLNDELIPTGEIFSTIGSKFDFISDKYLLDDLDDNFVISDRSYLKKAAVLSSEKTGISMEVYTTKPGIQIYTGNFLKSLKGKNNSLYEKNAGICLEPQFFPNATEYSHFSSPIIKSNDKYEHKTVYLFKY